MSVFRVYVYEKPSVLMTSEAYKQFALDLDIGSFASHKAKSVDYVDIDYEEPIFSVDSNLTDQARFTVIYKKQLIYPKLKLLVCL